MNCPEIKKTNCHFCGYLCAFEAHVENGRVVELDCDATRYPYDEAILRGCRRWKTNLSFLDDPKRINYPLKRQGNRGDNQWQQVSWEEALDDIAARLKTLIESYGAQTLASAIGGPHATYWPLHRFLNLLGSPNNMGIGQICWNPRVLMDTVTFGWTLESDIDLENTEAFILWATNPAQSDNSAFWRTILRYAKSDNFLIVVDPVFTQAAAKADLWLPIRPGTDCALALGLIQVIIEENLIDSEFVNQWCSGFDELSAAAKDYTSQKVAALCGLEEQDVRQAARKFAQAKASAVVSGRGIDQIGKETAPTHRAIACLRALTGNIDKPGACYLTEKSDFVPEMELEMSDSLSDEQKAFCLNTAYTPLQSYQGYSQLRALTEKLGRTLPMRYMSAAHPDLVWQAVLEGKPYPVRALIVEATNPLLTFADTKRVFEALSSLDLLVVLDYYLTPTASLADYVLPVAGGIERPVLQAQGGVANVCYGGPKAVEPYYERRSDYEIFRELGIRFGQAHYWQDETLEDAFETTLAPTGLTWESFCQTGLYSKHPGFYKHLRQNEKGEPQGFATTTGKVELASEFLPLLGGDRVPRYGDLPSAEKGEGNQEAKANNLFPEEEGWETLTLMSGARKQPYNGSMFLNVAEFRKSYPCPLAELSKATATRLDLKAGDQVVLATEKGQVCFTVAIKKMIDDAVSADYGWWFPEREPGTPSFGGIWESNINNLTEASLGGAEPLIGSWNYNALSCKIKRRDEIERG